MFKVADTNTNGPSGKFAVPNTTPANGASWTRVIRLLRQLNGNGSLPVMDRNAFVRRCSLSSMCVCFLHLHVCDLFRLQFLFRGYFDRRTRTLRNIVRGLVLMAPLLPAECVQTSPSYGTKSVRQAAVCLARLSVYCQPVTDQQPSGVSRYP